MSDISSLFSSSNKKHKTLFIRQILKSIITYFNDNFNDIIIIPFLVLSENVYRRNTEYFEEASQNNKSIKPNPT